MFMVPIWAVVTFLLFNPQWFFERPGATASLQVCHDTKDTTLYPTYEQLTAITKDMTAEQKLDGRLQCPKLLECLDNAMNAKTVGTNLTTVAGNVTNTLLPAYNAFATGDTGSVASTPYNVLAYFAVLYFLFYR